MYLPKEEIYKTLLPLEKSIKKCKVYQSHPDTFKTLPSVTFSMLDNSINQFLDNSIASQNITIQVNIWGETSKQCGEVLNELEELMRNKLYRMSYCADVPNIGTVKHMVCRFNTLI